MSKKRLKRIEEKLDLLLKLAGASPEQLKTIGGGGIKPPTNTGNGG